MIDEDKKEEQLDEEEIVVELPDEKSEDETKVKSEGPKDTKAPVVAEETIESEAGLPSDNALFYFLGQVEM